MLRDEQFNKYRPMIPQNKEWWFQTADQPSGPVGLPQPTGLTGVHDRSNSQVQPVQQPVQQVQLSRKLKGPFRLLRFSLSTSSESRVGGACGCPDSVILAPSSSRHRHQMTKTPTTVSMCAPETEEGKHLFEIFGYSKHRGMGQDEDKFIRSGTFSVGGHDWSIRFYPDGYDSVYASNPDSISVFLELRSHGASVRASCDLRLVDQHTGMSASEHKTEPRMFSFGEYSMYAPHTNLFMDRSSLESSVYLKDDHLTIECIVTVFKEPQVSETKSRPRIQVPAASEIGEHLGKLLETGQGADVTFRVRGQTFRAHKSVLAVRSPVFEAEFFGPMKEATAQLLTIRGINPAVFRTLLHFIYTDSLPAFDDLERGLQTFRTN
ncbi:hypothetical protein C2845_PM13G06460 [Panicum miliaceum]|uniref:BTB/POZ and MATH domain-containing protein 2-like n=1 Tax=Panicum miliaceum TaxID=4540 RepID=A0A3L6RI02_PANMI|nr:hypothetical protein C2845_PM13G06460 [Panicum miliaceum]